MLAVGLLVLGAALLYLGAETAVRSTSGLARALGIPAFVLGALLFGIDLESLGAALVASGRGSPGIATGTIFGSVLFLFSAAFGTALLLARRPVPSPEPIMVVTPALPLVVAALALEDRYVSSLEGALLVALYGAYVFLVVWQGRLAPATAERIEREAEEAPRSRMLLAGGAVLGLGLLYLGAAVLVAGGERVLEGTGLYAGFVGAAVIGVLASLDEVLLEVVPIRRGAPDLATGNLFGSLAAFSSGVLGLAALVRPLDVDSGAALAFLGSAALYAVVATTFLVRGRAGRGLGAAVILLYAGWLVAAASA